MADFVAVLRKAIDSLGSNTPEMREKVFEKARSTIEARLRAIEPPPPDVVIERQRKALEDAIATLRADYAEPAALPDSNADEALESVFAALDQPVVSSAPPVVPPPVTPMPPAAPPVAAVSAPTPEPEFGRQAKPAEPFPDFAEGDQLPGDSSRPAMHAKQPAAARQKRSKVGLVAALIVVLAAAGGGYFWWNSSSDMPALPAKAPVAGSDAEGQEEDVAALSPQPEATPPASSQPEAGAADPEKFTQRLLPDGSEVDDGPAGGEPAIGEGSSVAAAIQPPAAPETTAPLSEATEDTATTEPQQAVADAGEATEQTQQAPPTAVETSATTDSPQQPTAVTVGQRAIFYEERTSTADGSAEMGSIAWSVVQESPGGDLPPEPAIRAEAIIPGKDVQLRMTIRRNGDQTLPASHIVEMIFLTPEGFGGGGVTSVSRIAFKETEQAAGSPLVGIPAKIADGFFLIALSDAPAETQANLNLLARQNWLDIPIVYQSGQRALLSLEKGIPGDRVFQEALQAWSSAENG